MLLRDRNLFNMPKACPYRGWGNIMQNNYKMSGLAATGMGTLLPTHFLCEGEDAVYEVGFGCGVGIAVPSVDFQ